MDIHSLFGIGDSDLEEFDVSQEESSQTQSDPLDQHYTHLESSATVSLPYPLPSLSSNIRSYIIPEGFINIGDESSSTTSPYTIHIRRDPDGTIHSNANIVFWSNGDVTFHIGSKTVLAKIESLSDLFKGHYLAQNYDEAGCYVTLGQVDRKLNMQKVDAKHEVLPKTPIVKLESAPRTTKSHI
ncbi:hypothetical protein GEMRC1_003951 [Eukaryota sp. GEM-RC1]